MVFDGNHAQRIASSGSSAATPDNLPESLISIAQGGISQSFLPSDLGVGEGLKWQRLLFSINASTLSVYSLFVGERVIGALTVALDEESTSAISDVYSIFASQIALAIDKAELHKSIEDASMSMKVQNRILTELTDELEILSLRRSVQRLIRNVLGDSTVALLPIDSNGRVTVPTDLSPSKVPSAFRIATTPELGYISEVLSSKRSCIKLARPDLRACASLGLSEMASTEQLDQWELWGVSLGHGDRTNGILLLAVYKDKHESSKILAKRVKELLLSITPAISIALENSLLFARQKTQADLLKSAGELTRKITTCPTKAHLYEELCEGLFSLFNSRRIAIYDTQMTMHYDVGHAGTRSYDKERGLISTSMHRRYTSSFERPDRICYAIPLLSADSINASVYIEQPNTATPEQEADNLSLLKTICDHASACLTVLSSSEQIESNYKATIQALVHALEAKDQYTADHSDAVADWALSCGKRLGMNESDLRDLELAAILHDIGKVAIPDVILHKPSRLTEDEFEVMKSHTIIGEHILQPIGFLERVAPIVRSEHERWDGRGYPDGLSGDDIPLASRIIFVCDAYHAITSDRPYRKGQSHGFANKILIENAGTQFDPAVVSIFIEVVDQWHIENEVTIDLNTEGEEIVNPLGKVSSSEDDALAA